VIFLGVERAPKRGMVPYPKGPIEKQKEVKNYLILFLGVYMIFLLLFSKYFYKNKKPIVKS
jgi:hypothetical protein